MELKGHTIGFKGEYSATVLKADGTVKEFLNEEKTLRSGDVIKNLLLDNFFDLLVGSDTVGNNNQNTSVRVGVGSAAVAVGQTTLSNQLTLNSGAWPTGNMSNLVGVITEGVFRVSRRFVYTFTLGQISGNISELGVNMQGTTTGSNRIVHSRALVTDALGNPTTISVTSNEQLILTYSLRAEVPATDMVYNVGMLVNGVVQPIEVTTRLASLTTLSALVSDHLCFNNPEPHVFNGELNGIGVTPGGSSASVTRFSPAYNVSGGKNLTLGFSISQGNLSGGIRALLPTRSFDSTRLPAFKFGFNPPIPKNADRTLSITIHQTFGRLP